ncbi:MAG: hypothetical protein ACJA1M_000394 [Alphaproteobacteria bacterium]|jgi:hypothetical protein
MIILLFAKPIPHSVRMTFYTHNNKIDYNNFMERHILMIIDISIKKRHKITPLPTINLY